MESITFLDLAISKHPEGHLLTSLYQKSTAGNTIFEALSFHYKPLLNPIPFGQYVQAKRNCSNDTLYEKETATLRARLWASGYSNSVLKKAYHKAKNKIRSDLLFSHKQVETDNQTRVVTQYTSQHKQIRQILQKYWHLFYIDATLAPLLKDCPLITLMRAPSLQDKLAHSKLTMKKNINKYCGTFPCGHCRYCKYLDTRKNIILPNGEDFKHYANSYTAGIVYLLTCECGCFYIGKTKLEIWHRIYRHVASVQKQDPSLPLGRHSALIHGHKCLQI